MKRKLFGLVVLFLMAGVFSSFAYADEDDGGQPSSSAMDFAYKTYFHFHPPQDRTLKHNLYPYANDPIQTGMDIPVCPAAKSLQTYARKRDLKVIEHGQNGWLFRTVDFRTDFSPSPQSLEYFKRLNKTLADHGQTLVVAFQPPRAYASAKFIDPNDTPKDYTPAKALKGYEAFLKQLNDAGIITADLSDLSKFSSTETYFSKGDFHWAPAGSSDAAEKVAAVLEKLPGYKGLAKQDFVSESIGIDVASRGAYEEFIQQTCQENIELTTKPVWATHAAGAGSADPSGLLGDVAFPAVTVIGTSNSAEDDKFNFVGALKHFAHTDIYNAALTAGGFSSSAYRYYASDEYHEHPPKIVVWEFLPQHNFNNTESVNGFRQMIPAVYGACSKDKALAAYDGDITKEQTTFFDKIEKISLDNTYLYLDVKDPKERNLSVEVLYKNGDADQVDLTRSTRIANNGKYFYELGNPGDTNALFFHLITDSPKGHMTARLCPYPSNTTVAEK
jgi:alginate biosynthesis protein AlgX